MRKVLDFLRAVTPTLVVLLYAGVSLGIGAFAMKEVGFLSELIKYKAGFGVVFVAIIFFLYQLKTGIEQTAEKTSKIETMMDRHNFLRNRLYPQVHRYWLLVWIVAGLMLVYILSLYYYPVDKYFWSHLFGSILMGLATWISARLIHQYFTIRSGLNSINFFIEKEVRKEEKRKRLLDELRKDARDHPLDNDGHLDSYTKTQA